MAKFNLKIRVDTGDSVANLDELRKQLLDVRAAVEAIAETPIDLPSAQQATETTNQMAAAVQEVGASAAETAKQVEPMADRLSALTAKSSELSDSLRSASPKLSSVADAMAVVSKASNAAEKAIAFKDTVADLVSGSSQGVTALTDLSDAVAATGQRSGSSLSSLKSLFRFGSKAIPAAGAAVELGLAIYDLSKATGIGEEAIDGFLTDIESLGNGIKDSFASGKMAAEVDAFFAGFSGYGDDINALYEQLVPDEVAQQFTSFAESMMQDLFGVSATGPEAANLLIEAISGLPENTRALIQLMTIEIASLIDAGSAYGSAFVDVLSNELHGALPVAEAVGKELLDLLNPFDGDTFDFGGEFEKARAEVSAENEQAYETARQKIEAINEARRAGIVDSIAERDATKATKEEIQKLGELKLQQYRDNKKNKTNGGADGESSKASEKALQRLQTLEAENELLQQGNTLREAQSEIQEQQNLKQLESSSVSTELIEKIAAAEDAQRKLVNAQKDQGVISQLKQQLQLQQKTAREQFIQAEQAKLTASATEDQVKEVRKFAGELYDQNEGMKAANALQQDFEQAMESVAVTLTESLVSGDWDNAGQQIGAILGTVIGNAVLPGIGGAIGGVIGGSLFGKKKKKSKDPSKKRQDRQNTGDILGGINEKAQSIAESTKLTAEILSESVGFNRSLYKAQDQTDLAVNEFAAEVAKALEPMQGLKYLKDIGIKFGDNGAEVYADSKYGSFFENSTEKFAKAYAEIRGIDVAGSGEKAIQSIWSLVIESLDNLGININEDYETSPLKLDDISLDELSDEEFSEVISQTFGSALNQATEELIPEIKKFVNKIGESSGQVLIDFARNSTIVNGALDGLNSSLGDITGLELGQISTDLVDMFGGVSEFSAAIQGLANDFLTEEEKSKLNEKRIKSEFQQLNDQYSDINISLPDNKAGMAQLIDDLDLSSESGQAALESISRSSGSIASYFQLIEENEKNRLDFANSLMTPEEQFKSLKSELEDELGTLPKTKEGFAELFNQLDENNEADAERIQTIVELRGKVEQYYNTLEERERERLEEAQQSTDLALSDLRSVIDHKIQYIQDQLKLDKDALEQQRKTAIESAKLRVDSAKEQVSSLKDTVKQISSAYDSLRDKVKPLQELDRQQAVSKLQLAASNGVLTDVGEYASKATEIDSSQYVDGISFEREQRKTLALLEHLDADGNAQLSTAEKQLRASELQIETIEASFDKQINAIELAAEHQINNLESLYAKQEEELDILRGSNEHLGSIKTQLASLHSAMEVEKSAQRDVNNMSKNEQDVRQLYWKILGREADQGGLNTWLSELNAGKTLKDVEWAIVHSQEFANQRNDKYSDVHGRAAVTGEVRRLYQEILGRIDEGPAGVGFFINEVLTGRRSLTRVERDLRWVAMDGSHAKGLNRVPFDGYRAELHRDEMVLTADVANTVRRSVQSNAKQSSDTLTRSVEAIRNELALVQSYLRSISISTSVTANTMDDWDAVGMPAERQIEPLEGVA